MSIQIQIVKSFGQSIRSLIIMISSFGLDLNLSEPCRSARSVGQVNADNVVTGESGQWRAERVQPDYSCRRKVCPEAQFLYLLLRSRSSHLCLCVVTLRWKFIWRTYFSVTWGEVEDFQVKLPYPILTENSFGVDNPRDKWEQLFATGHFR